MSKKILIFAILLIQSCQKKDKRNSFLKDYANVNYAVVIPNEGCTGCISQASDFFMKNIDKNIKGIVIYTNVSDFKIFKKRFPKRYLDSKKVLIDTKNVFISDNIMTYPTYFYLDDDNEIISQEILTKKHLNSILKEVKD